MLLEEKEYLQKELARVEGRLLSFGFFQGWELRQVPRDYLHWCLHSVRLPPDQRRNIIDVLCPRTRIRTALPA